MRDAAEKLFLGEWVRDLGVREGLLEPVTLIVSFALILAFAWTLHRIARVILVQALRQFVTRTSFQWDNILLDRRVFHRLSHLIPALAIRWLTPLALGDGYPRLLTATQIAVEVYFAVVALMVFNALLEAINDIYQNFPVSRRVPIRGYLQLVQIGVAIIAGAFIFSVVSDKSPWFLLSGLGAATAVLLLIFKDTILGLVAGVQLVTNDMVRPGDWIQMPKHGADGEVIEITLATVKVRNWDKTITTIPPYALVSDSFKNWRGMSESGGRRIKRSLYLDINSIRFCSPEMLQRFRRNQLLRDYIERKEREVEEYNRKHGVGNGDLSDGRRMTNIGTFRAYLVEYLRRHPKIHQRLTLMVRQLDPTERGLPIEVYAFSNDQAWINYESIQSDIFDHIFAILPFFELRPFQNPTGADFRSALGAAHAQPETHRALAQERPHRF